MKQHNFNEFFLSQIFFVYLMVAQRHVRAVSKHSLPCWNGDCTEKI